MAWAAEIGALVKDIQTSHRDRTHFVTNSRRETHELLADYDKFLKEMASELKKFLAKSEEDRKSEFNSMMREIRARIKDIAGNTDELLTRFDKEMKELAVHLKDFFAKSESTRRADFKAMMEEIEKTINSIQHSVKASLGDYKAERKEAAANWASLPERRTATEEAAAEVEEAEPVHKKKHKK